MLLLTQAKDFEEAAAARRKQMIFKSISHLSVVPSVAPTPKTRTDSLLPVISGNNNNAAGGSEETGGAAAAGEHNEWLEMVHHA